MKKFKKIFITSIIIFIISALIHSLYNMLPNFVTSIFFPVNEAIWEHMKMIFTAYVLFLIIGNLFFNKKENALTTLVTGLFNIAIFLIIYLPINAIFGEILFVTLFMYFISIVISVYFKIYINKKINNFKRSNLFGIFGIIIVYIIFTLLTYFPLPIYIFYDALNNKFGLKKIK